MGDRVVADLGSNMQRIEEIHRSNRGPGMEENRERRRIEEELTFEPRDSVFLWRRKPGAVEVTWGYLDQVLAYMR